ncbi:hypothetical protein AB0K74_41605 [Streptomyces sp. NPDC056159]|uniref:hypothetical protein n=1 Tax=Streptomyces sp. NPDC056159 TaxID=3155537 RepID=UPI0034453BCB
MAKEVVSKCDRCGTSEGAQEFNITYGGETRELDLCPEHSGPILELFELGKVLGKRPTSRRTGHAVVPIEEWQEGQ